jgi:hypothetical protein
MSRRRIAVLTTLAAITGGIAPLATGAHAAGTPATVMPKAGCFDISDPSGDASYPSSAVASDPDLDILGAAFQTTATDFMAFIKVNKLADGPMLADGHRYSVYFNFGNHQYAVSGSHYANGSGAIRDGLASTGQAGHVTQLGIDVPAATTPTTSKGFVDSGLKFTFDTTNSWVIADLPLADISKNAGGAKFAGQITGLAVVSGLDRYAVSSVVDTTEVGNAATYSGVWKVGTNKCFPAPKPAKKKKK